VAAKTFDQSRLVTIFPLTAKELADLLSVEKQVYLPPLEGVASLLLNAEAGNPRLQALWSYGRDFLEAYELHRLKGILGKDEEKRG
jgi:hypothetical protein